MLTDKTTHIIILRIAYELNTINYFVCWFPPPSLSVIFSNRSDYNLCFQSNLDKGINGSPSVYSGPVGTKINWRQMSLLKDVAHSTSQLALIKLLSIIYNGWCQNVTECVKTRSCCTVYYVIASPKNKKILLVPLRNLDTCCRKCASRGGGEIVYRIHRRVVFGKRDKSINLYTATWYC